MATQRFVIGNTGSQNIDLSTANTITLNGSTKVNVSNVINSPAYQKGGLDADVVKLGNSYSPATSTTCGLQLPATLSATGYTTIFGINNMTNSTAGGGVSVIVGSRNLLSASFTGLGEIVVGDRNLQTLNTGNNNLAFGAFNANLMTTGTSNTFLGGFHAQNTTTGSNIICVGQGNGLPATCDHSITMGSGCTGASNHFIFGTGTNFTRFASGCTTNTVDLGSATQQFKTAHIATSVQGAGTQSIALTGNDINATATNIQLNATTELKLGGVPYLVNPYFHDSAQSSAPTGIPNTANQLQPLTGLSFTTNGGNGFTNSNGTITYTGLRTQSFRVNLSFTFLIQTNTLTTMTFYINKNTVVAPITAQAKYVFSATTNALTNTTWSGSVQAIISLATNDTIVGVFRSSLAQTGTYSNVAFSITNVLN